MEVRADDVVRRSDHGTQLAGDVGVEPEGAERADLGHGFLERRGGRAQASGPSRTGVGPLHRTIGAVGRPLDSHPSIRHTGGPCNFSGCRRVVAPTTPPQPESPCPAGASPSRQLLRRAGTGPRPPSTLLPAAAATGRRGRGRLTMTARALLQGHVRAGSWFAIAVDLANAGPAVTGELRITGGADSRTRFSTPVELATGSRKEYLLYALPPSFGGNMKVQLVNGESVLAQAPVAVASHDQTQLVVGVVAENPAKIVGELDLPANQNSVAPVIATLTPADLPERIQAWSAIDRLIWQDTDAATLTSAQLAALRVDRRWREAGHRRRHGRSGLPRRLPR